MLTTRHTHQEFTYQPMSGHRDYCFSTTAKLSDRAKKGNLISVHFPQLTNFALRTGICPMKLHILVLLIAMCLPLSGTAALQIRISGYVSDTSGGAVPYANVRIKGSGIGGTTDSKGYFSFTCPSERQTLCITAIGYREYQTVLDRNTVYPLHIELEDAVYEVGEIEVRPGREHYTRHGNPAVQLIKEIVAGKDNNSPESSRYYSRERFERLDVALDNFSEKKLERPPYRKFQFLKEYIDTSSVSGKPILNISTRQIAATDYYQQKPHREKRHIHARRWVGVDDFMSAGSIQAAVEEAVTDIDLFSNTITIFKREFPSPLASDILSQSCYKYYITDTVTIDNEKCIDLSFVPFNTRSFAFTGHLYVTADTVHFVKRAQLNVPFDINMNFVQYIDIDLQFTRDGKNRRLLTGESFATELKIYDFIDGLYVRRDVHYSDYAFDDEVDRSIFERPENVIEDDNADALATGFPQNRNIEQADRRSADIASMLEQLRQNRLYYWTERGIMFLFSGYVPIQKENTPYYYGPLNTTISYNNLEGIRLRTGGMTTAYLNPHLFARYYIAYGVRDSRWKYMGQLEYSFLPKKESCNEFPIHSLRLSYKNDVVEYGQTFNYTNRDNVFLSLRRMADDKSAYRKNAELTYTNEFYNGFSIAATIRNRIDQGSRLLGFERIGIGGGDAAHIPAKQFMQTELELKLRYAPGEKFIQKHWDRFSVTPQKPVFTLTHTMASNKLPGSDYSMQRTELEYRQRIFITPFGYFDAVLGGGRTWGQIPFQLMMIPNTNLSFALRKEAFELMVPMEYILDSYVSWDIEYSMNGFLFNRIPLLKKMGLREIITSRGIWGTLSDCNNPETDKSGNLFGFPSTALALPMGGTPYTELGIGIENIFKVLRLDYYVRLTHRNTPGAPNHGLRFAVHVEF